MIASRAHKIKLMPTPEQQEKLRRRFLQGQTVRHLCIEWSREMYAAWKQDPANNAYPSYEAMDKRYTKEKPEEGNLLPRCSAQRKVRDTWKAVENHIKHPDKYACPDYTKKRDVHEYTLYLNNQAAEVGTDHGKPYVHFPKLGLIRLAEEFRFKGARIMSYTFSWDCVDMYVSIQAQVEVTPMCTNDSTVGVDVGLKHIAVASDGTTLDYPKAYKKAQKRVRAEQRKLQRKVQDSNNYWKQYRRLKKAYKRKANVINDALHKYTTRLCKTHSTVVTENLSIADLIKTSEKWMRRGFALSQMKRLIQLLQYKAAIYRQVERFFASSKTCSRCGYKNNALTLADRTYVCPECGLQIDRDLNAAHNIRNFIVGSVRPDLR